jgi:hypothetical protein
MNPQLEIHAKDFVGMLQEVTVCEALSVEDTKYRFLENNSADAMALTLAMAMAMANGLDVRKALEDLRKFMAPEFSFKESF